MIDRSQNVYRTVKSAMNDVCLDYGFDPFVTGHVAGRPTKAKLAEMGYHVDAAEYARRQRDKDPRCTVCGRTLAPHERERYTGLGKRVRITECPDHEKWSFGCDNGHRWQATKAEDDAADHKCPVCGEYWV